jgi:hypothetical protein
MLHFVPVFRAFLKQWSGVDTNGSTELDGIKKTESATKTPVNKGQARMGNLWFEETAKGWKLFIAYLNDAHV